MTDSSARAELATAIRVVNRIYSALDTEDQAKVAIVGLEPVEATLKSDDDVLALAAVADWSYRQLEAIRGAAR